MKDIAETLGKGWIRTVVLPGLVGAIGVHPLLSPLLMPVLSGVYPISEAVLFVLEVGLLGVIVSAYSFQIVGFFQGHFLPRPVNEFLFRYHGRRLARLEGTYLNARRLDKGATASPSVALRVRKSLRKILDYPLRKTANDVSEFYVSKPTLLGNIIDTGMTYPTTRFGLNGVGYWHHLLFSAPSVAREEFTNVRSLAQSLLLASFVGYFVLGIGISYFVLRLAHSLLHISLATSWVSDGVVGLLSAAGLVIGCMAYVAGLSAYRETSRLFQVVVDLGVLRVRSHIRITEQALDEDITEAAERVRRYRRYFDEQGPPVRSSDSR